MVKLMSSRHPRIISFISASGGVGKTKLALLFTYWLRKEKKASVLFIDLDPTAGASFSVFDDEELDKLIERNKTFSDMIKHKNEGQNVNFSEYKVIARIIDAYIDFMIPGDDLIDVISDYWKKGSAGPIFKKTLESLIPTSRYGLIIIDTAPFFDPRYTTLSIYISDFLLIPLTPSIVDMRRNLKMLEKIRDDIEISLSIRGIDIDVEQYMRNNILCIFNKVPTRTNQAEHIFVEKFIKEELLKTHTDVGRPSMTTLKRVEKLIRYASILSSRVAFLPTYLKQIDAVIGRFPRDVSGSKVIEAAEDYLKSISGYVLP